MRSQLAHLLDVAQKPKIKVLGDPGLDRCAHVGVGGPYVIAEFRNPPEVAYLDTAAGGQIADHPDIVKACAQAFDTLRAEALPPRASLDLIAEVEHMDLSRAVWRKASASGNGNCVEVAVNLPGVVAVRDSKNPASPALTFTPDAWRAFTGRATRRAS